MQTDVLSRFRAGLAKGEFTLTQIKQATNIPLATLSDMKDESWRPQVFDRLEKLEAALDEIGRSGTEQSEEQGREPTAA